MNCVFHSILNSMCWKYRKSGFLNVPPPRIASKCNIALKMFHDDTEQQHQLFQALQLHTSGRKYKLLVAMYEDQQITSERM